MPYSIDPEIRAEMLLSDMYAGFGLVEQDKLSRLSAQCMGELRDYAAYVTEAGPYWLITSFECVTSDLIKANTLNSNISAWMFDNTPIVVESIAYWEMQQSLIEKELKFRLEFSELGMRFSPIIEHANKRINEIGRRLLVRKPFWPFIHVKEGIVMVRRVRKSSEVGDISKLEQEWPRTGPEDGLWSPQPINGEKTTKKRQFPNIYRY